MLGLFSPEKLKVEIALSPNPANHQLHVQVKAPVPGDFWILLNDAQGRLVKKETLNAVSEFEKTIDVSNLPTGSYTITLSNAKGSVTHVWMKM